VEAGEPEPAAGREPGDDLGGRAAGELEAFTGAKTPERLSVSPQLDNPVAGSFARPGRRQVERERLSIGTMSVDGGGQGRRVVGDDQVAGLEEGRQVVEACVRDRPGRPACDE
jgi:hypothetical protein